MTFIRRNSDEYIREAKMYSVADAIEFGLEKAIILSTGSRIEKLDYDKINYYFPEIKNLELHLEELKELGLITYDINSSTDSTPVS